MQKPDGFKPFKFRDLKVYASKENLVDDKKKYRQVFEKSEVSFVYAEFSFYNKLFDEEAWPIHCQLKAFELSGRQICNIDVKQTIDTQENIVYIRQGWGVDKVGGFWSEGTYYWEAWIDGEKIDTSTYFYIVDKGRVTLEENPFFRITSLKLYEADQDDCPRENRTYYKVFDKNATRFVWVEFEAENLLFGDQGSWPCELLFNFYSDTGQLKGYNHELIMVNGLMPLIHTSAGWGSKRAGSWYADDYKLEVVFMDRVIAVLPFSAGEAFEEAGDQFFYLPGSQATLLAIHPEEVQDERNPVEALDDLIGLENIKTMVKEYITYLNFLSIRNKKGLEGNEKPSLHSVFVGNPGTGKTSVAQMMGRIYKNMGLLTRGHVYEVDRSHLVGEYIGQTAPKVKEAITKAKGGILFIDEAYSLARKSDDAKDFGREVIEILLKEMSDGEGNIAVIVAGYPEEMQNFLDSNPGLRSRFTHVFNFPDYTPQELILISEYTAIKRGIALTADARECLYDELVRKYRARDRTFGNARLVNSLIEVAKVNMGLRLMGNQQLESLSAEELSTVRLEDVQKIFRQSGHKWVDIPVDEEPLRHNLHELGNLIGLEVIKNEIAEMVQLVRFYKEIGKNVRDEFNLHTIFVGNPGTGKTTVARLMANIYKHLGILERGHLVEVDRQKLVAGYLGQTAQLTTRVIDEAIGGVLFIDEAYTLQQGPHDSYGNEAIATLLKRMEDQRGEFVVIAAGYPENMDSFLNSNPGLRSRFDKTFSFEDYRLEDLMQIALSMFSKEGVTPTPEAHAHLERYMDELVNGRDKYFGNARSVRKIVDQAVKNQHLRLAKMNPKQRTREMLKELELADVQEFSTLTAPDRQRAAIGFKRFR
ncbi:MAG: AAA family ATPase [Bacteroidetes bacterium]|jgi:SpoVK/Ycf46/Vps4 family AAA+-type ATPase|nr:AAA family ATPase [Bacteroidota bacterium]